jgi:site-specific recombinase XerD
VNRSGPDERNAALAGRQEGMHPDWPLLVRSWTLAMDADGYSKATVRAYRQGVASLTGWLESSPPLASLAPADLTREHVRGWLAEVRVTRSQSTAHAWFPAVRHFCRFLVEEGEVEVDATAGVKTPRPAEPHTRVLSEADLRRLLKACEGRGFASRRDAAIILLFVDGGLRLAELAGLQTDDVDIVDRVVYVAGKGSMRSGPRHRAIPLGTRAARALDRYLRERRRHPWATRPALWLGDRGRPGLGTDAIDMVVKRRAAAAGLQGVHCHMLRHTWAGQFRQAGGSEGDLLVLGGWRSRQQLDRYGRASAQERAAEAARRYSLGDRL